MKWRALVLLLLAFPAFGAIVRLYLKDGTYQLVREYQELPDRVKYLSAERGGVWEEVPLGLVDLDRTKREIVEHEAKLAKEAKEDAEEDAAIRAEKRLAASVPDESGAYYLHGEMLEPLAQADVTAVSDKLRTVLRDISTIGLIIIARESQPIAVMAKKSTLELEGAAARFRVTEDRPEFYFRLSASDGVSMVRLSPKGSSRTVEGLSIEPVTNEPEAKRDTIPTFTRQVGELLFKIWPEQPLPPGEYAVIEFDDARGTLQVWDFGIDGPE